MELIYAWVEDFRNIKQTGFSFSDRFRVSYKGRDDQKNDPDYRKLMIEENEDYFDYFRFAGGEKSRVTNVSAVVGVNGCGKSNLLDLIGNNHSGIRLFKQYFFIYWIQEDHFLIEGTQTNTKTFFSNLDLNIHNNCEKVLNYCYFLTGCKLRQDNIELIDAPNSPRTSILKYTSNTNYKEVEETIIGKQIYRFQHRNYLSLLNEFQYISNSPHIIPDESKILTITNTLRPASHPMSDASEPCFIENYGLKENHPKEESKKNKYYKKHFLVGLLRDALNSLLIEILNTSDNNFNYLKFRYCPNDDEDIDELSNCITDIRNDYDHTNGIDFYFFTEMIKKLNPSFFSTSPIITIDPIKNKDECYEFLREFQTIEFSANPLLKGIKITFNGNSDGEKALIKIFSHINDLVKNAFHSLISDNKTSSTKNQSIKHNFILLLDEPDLYLHPEWNRQFIMQLEKELTLLGNKYCKKRYETFFLQEDAISFQIIIASHSPFILSDLPSGNVIRLDKYSSENAEKYTDRKYEDGQCVLVKDKNEKYLAANIHELFSDKFFMKSTIGEYAKQTLDRVIKEITNEKHIYTESEYQDTLAFVNQIAEPLIRQKLRSMLLEKVDRSQRLTEVRKEIDRLKKIEKELEKSEKNS